jgi:hypothetical protein
MGEKDERDSVSEAGGGDIWDGTAMVAVPRAADVHVVAVDTLLPGESPRLFGEHEKHVELLTESAESLPPILVHRPTLRVVDGMHRLKAALRRGQATIQVQFFDGTDFDCFIAAVKANTAHGLPLTLADRRAAAARILTSHAHWSDRAIAAVAGLAPKTVGAIRRRHGGDADPVESRLGRDGKIRTLRSAPGRRLASEMFASRPDVSLREVAATAGISRATARDVRQRMRRGESPLVGPESTEEGAREHGIDRRRIIENLAQDPSLRFTEPGRTLLRWIARRSIGLQDWGRFVDSVPPHCSYKLVILARACANDWLAFADELERRIRRMA